VSMSVLRLIVEAVLVGASSWMACRWLAPRASGPIECLLGWGVMFVAFIVGTGVLLGATRGLGAGGFAASQLLILVSLLLFRRRHVAADSFAARTLGLAFLAETRKSRGVFILVVGMGIFLVITFVMAAFAGPVVYDALTYRLSRIGHWLQEGRMMNFPTNDPRQNYMPTVADLVMTWLVGVFPEGFPAVAIAQWGGGVLLVLATAGLARIAGLDRAAAIGATWLAVGLANVSPQFTTAHTDLITAGLLAAAFYLWQKAAMRGSGSWVAGIAGGLAFGAKGTVLYLGPSLLLWAVWTGWQLRLPAVVWRRTLFATLLASVLFALPGFMRNWQTYGSIFGPPEFIAMHHQGSGGQLMHKVGLNLGTSLVQVLDPNSQPMGLRTMTLHLAEILTKLLPVNDPFSYENLNRRLTLETITGRKDPDADATSFGLPMFGFFVFGALLSARSNRTGAGLVRQWSLGVVLFFVFFHAMQQWHPYGFRYFVLVVPWMAVIAVWGFAGLPKYLGQAVWTLALISAATTAWHILANTPQAGWRAMTQPEGSRNYYVYDAWRKWTSTLGDGSERLQLVLPFNRPLAAFYRLQPARTVQPHANNAVNGLTAEQTLYKLGGGWLIVPALQFMGNEGHVQARLWLYNGDPADPFSLAAYHQLSAGRGEEPMVYRHKIIPSPDRARHELLLRVGDSGKLTVRCESAIGEGWRYVITSPMEVLRGEWPGGLNEIPLSLPAQKVSEVLVFFQPLNADRPHARTPSIAVRP
jgi:hypothetical protein